ncbi:hypothetical protein AMIS_41840 [Actinoplanes missouriensis 431]|uniref:Uncharacterized protein n=1 Tax=Actinoplanes missouriensis (strain ATCC 14538 / DSM 43046 / CBS 188.64 / JCM 3121 / NBRC 102363 / NCIMB 12654 / NRRL B-3342 / UNCC 431) TaxID=512565 RepID=I0H8R7_ACTM4|nr:hypothetical protein [Actinoplanes missouriensis]BAL89404.1 hypothetical protein AMIS_41840 [Actinoplanes missouriensis 431]
MSSSNEPSLWTIDKLTALRLGRRLVTEVAASGPGRRAFVDIRPVATTDDRNASREGWTRADRERTFQLKHWDYDADRIDGFDYDIGATLVKANSVVGESALTQALQAWGLRPEQFLHPWQTADPQ